MRTTSPAARRLGASCGCVNGIADGQRMADIPRLRTPLVGIIFSSVAVGSRTPGDWILLTPSSDSDLSNKVSVLSHPPRRSPGDHFLLYLPASAILHIRCAAIMNPMYTEAQRRKWNSHHRAVVQNFCNRVKEFEQFYFNVTVAVSLLSC